jgi:hypothetical protein
MSGMGSLLQLASIVLLALVVLTSCQHPKKFLQDSPSSSTVRIINITDKAWSGSSVNVLANVHQTLFTDSIFQYTAFYDEQARVVLGKRRLGQDEWQLVVSQFRGNASDAHNHISLVVDGAGFLHLSWDQHNVGLKYAVSVAPGSLQLTSTTMLNNRESAVTYPQFYRLLNGNLLFLYRNGGSGSGNIVLNRFDNQQRQWLRLHNNLLNGQDQRSAYWDMTVDANGVLHLAWMWRETPDVATNHDLYYTQSNDAGDTWQSIEGKTISLPISMHSLAPVWQIAQHHNLMNPPVIAADNHSVPFIASYWSETPKQAPQFGVVSFQQSKWQVYKGSKSSQAFSLTGTGTKNPPWSRASLLVESDWQKSGFHLIYRDNLEHAIMVASVLNIDHPQWTLQRLIDWPVDGWEPSIDPQQWLRLKQVHLLLQHVGQVDGNDSATFSMAPQRLELLIWPPL